MHYPATELLIDPVLMRKYDTPGPRYASYPTADRFVEAFGEAELRQWLGKRTIGGISRPLSVDLHLPSVRDMRDPGKYSNCLAREMALAASALGAEREIAEVHWAGGGAALLSLDECAALMASIDENFVRAEGCECALELELGEPLRGRLPSFASLGFSRVSFTGFDLGAAREAIAEARASGFRSVGVDLEYGMPRQTLDGFSRALEQLLALDPDRVALHGSAHANGRDLASAELRLQLLTLAVGRLTRAGYLYIGMDQFARADDELAAAQRQGRLWRGFHGYCTQPGDRLGIGRSAFGRIGPAYYQNHRDLGSYCGALKEGRLPVAHGLELTPDDLVRAAVIQSLMCQSCVSIEAIEIEHLVDFRRHFAAELADLRVLEREGLVHLGEEWITVSAKGRLLVGAICAVFDRYRRERAARAAYGKVM